MPISKKLFEEVMSDSSLMKIGTKDFDEKNQEVVNQIKDQYRSIYRIIIEESLSLIITDYITQMELFPEFDQMSGELLSFKGWIQIRSKDSDEYSKWQLAEVELKPLCFQNGIIYSVKGTLQWLASNSCTWLKDITRPISAGVKYKFPSGQICAFVPSFIGDSKVLRKAVIEFKSESFNVEITV